ncbi:MAG: outer membrane beta-barrel protein [Bacteroidales bacterium]|nr:outer membrane beta-barrel protein [Bacteroidales bacterium]
MKKFVSILVLLHACSIAMRAQVVIINDNLFKSRMSLITATVVDSLTNEALGFASVYVVPSKDTTITNFTLTDMKGAAKLEEVPYGSYVFHVEMMGYRPFVKERYFRDREVDMGTIRLQVDEQFLEAALVTDVGNPIVMKQDTIEFNAASFRVGANAMLKDLLKRMPGMEITEDGKVKFNGEEIDKLTVGGRTFFFGDQSTALNNLPASVVDKIRVIDRESEQTRATGIQDGSREKVLDVGLKKEYEKGWFGNVGLNAGTTLVPKDEDDPLRDDRGLLYNASVLASAYSEKDQVTFIADGQNISESEMVFVYVDEDGERTRSGGQGLSTAAQAGINVNTSRIKDVETTVGASYRYSDTDSGSRAERTTYQDDGNLLSTSENNGKAYANALSTNMEFQKENGNLWFHFRPSFRYQKQDSYDNNESEIYRAGTFVNNSRNASHDVSLSKTAVFEGDVTFRGIRGKDGRTIMLGADFNYGVSSGQSDETSVLTTSAGADSRTMKYDSGGNSSAWSGTLKYTEPLGGKWTLSASGMFSWSKRNNVRDAFDAAGRNDYYSSETRSDYLTQKYDLTAQYKFNDNSWFTVGGTLTGVLNETFSRSFGIEDITGKDEWTWFVTPTIRVQHSSGNDRLRVYTSGYTQRPGSSRMLPVLNITNPSRLTIGNVYLKPSSFINFGANWTRNNREKFSNMMTYLFGEVNNNPMVNALWYDSDGILYSVPVNSTKPSFTVGLFFNYTTPLDADKNWSISFGSDLMYTSSVSFQAGSTLAGLNKDTFDYSAFMADFWGDSHGNRFYGGQSGFAESRTRKFTPDADISVKFNQDHYSFSLGAGFEGRIARYSLNPTANMNTLNTFFTAEGSYTTKHEFELNTDLSYVFYRGYAEGYGQPEWQWNAEVNKSIGAFNLSFKVHDILNQTRNLTHTVTANYEEDSYRLIMGRYILFGVKWNFGKMNAAHSSRAQQAAWQMVF